MYDISSMILKENMFANPDYPRLVSFPRTGSHWFRLVMEFYLICPCAPQAFLVKTPNRCWGLHVHNRKIRDPHPSEGPVSNLGKVIYLYRNPIDVIWSCLEYENKSAEDYLDTLINEYKDHLERWLNNPADIKNICYIKYEDFKENPWDTFAKVLGFLEIKQIDKNMFLEIYKTASIANSRANFKHDNSVISRRRLSRDWKNDKEEFVKTYGERILKEFDGIYK